MRSLVVNITETNEDQLYSLIMPHMEPKRPCGNSKSVRLKWGGFESQHDPSRTYLSFQVKGGRKVKVDVILRFQNGSKKINLSQAIWQIVEQVRVL